MSARKRPAAKVAKRKARPWGHPARNGFAAELRELGGALITAQETDEMTQHGTAALWVSEHGRVFTHDGSPLPAGLTPGMRGKCFANAQQAALNHGLGYAEGFAGPSPAGRWTQHAWNLDDRGRVVDPTWDGQPGSHGRYFGVTFAAGRLPAGEDAGISLLADMLGGKLIEWDRRMQRVRVLDGTGVLAEVVKANGGVVYVQEAP